jgi:hypothetical protein
MAMQKGGEQAVAASGELANLGLSWSELQAGTDEHTVTATNSVVAQWRSVFTVDLSNR